MEALETPTEPQTSKCRFGIDISLSSETTDIRYNCERISKIENLHHCPNLKSLSLVSAGIPKLENLEDVVQLEELDLYHNQIHCIEGIHKLTNLRVLDLSFNRIKRIANLEPLVNLEELFLTNNQLKKIEGLQTLTKLKLLELGSNKIRSIENLDTLTELRSLWLGKNKIAAMELPYLPKLETLSLQCNRLCEWDTSIFNKVPCIIEFYVSENQLKDVPKEIQKWSTLTTLDLANNCFTNFAAITDNPNLEELWANNNKIQNLSDVSNLASLKNLKTVYLNQNPIQDSLGPGYRQAILDIAPWITQLDALKF